MFSIEDIFKVNFQIKMEWGECVLQNKVNLLNKQVHM